MIKVLLTGANGQLGRCLQDRFPKDWQVMVFSSVMLDITNSEQVKQQIERFKPDIIINAGAYTAVDKAESEPEKAFAVNATGVANLAIMANHINARLIHVSTDYVFDGESKKPYTPYDTPNPTTIYGKSKLAGELLAFAHHDQVHVIRTSWVYSEYGHNFVKTMLRLADEGKKEVKVVNDQIGCPTYAGNLAEFIIDLCQNPIEQKLLHYSDGEIMSWYEFAKQILGEYAKMGKVIPKVIPIMTADYPTPAERPKYSVMFSPNTVVSQSSLSKIIKCRSN